MTPKHTPATPLPWEITASDSEQYGLCAEDGGDVLADYMLPDDSLYAAHAANAYPQLVEAFRGVLNIYALQALRDSNDPDMLAGWRKNEAIIRDLLRSLGEL